MLRRLRTTPPAVLMIAALFALLPPLSYWLTARFNYLPLNAPDRILGAYNAINLTLLAACWILAVGLLTARKWAYYLFMVFAGGIIVYNLALFFVPRDGVHLLGVTVRSPGFRANLLLNLGVSLAALGTIFYFLHREVAAPFLSRLPRGWRRMMRDTLPLQIVWEGPSGKGSAVAVNISGTGAYLPIETMDLADAEQLIKLQITLDGQPVHVRARVLRTFPGGGVWKMGMALRFLAENDPDSTAESVQGLGTLHNFLEKHYAPRYALQGVVRFGPVGDTPAHTGALYNFSPRGLYLACNADVIPPVDKLTRLELPEQGLVLTGHVRWTNPTGGHGKQPGFGLEIERAEPRLRFFWLNRRLAYFAATRR